MRIEGMGDLSFQGCWIMLGPMPVVITDCCGRVKNRFAALSPSVPGTIYLSLVLDVKWRWTSFSGFEEGDYFQGEFYRATWSRPTANLRKRISYLREYESRLPYQVRNLLKSLSSGGLKIGYLMRGSKHYGLITLILDDYPYPWVSLEEVVQELGGRMNACLRGQV